jgi:hypothetical protein
VLPHEGIITKMVLSHVLTSDRGLSSEDQQTMFRMLQETLKKNEKLEQHFEDLRIQNQNLERHIVEVKATIKMQRNVPPQVLLQQPVILHDALGRIAPFHLEFITSAAALQAVLKVRFENVGLRKVVMNEYGLRDLARRNEINTSKPWESVIFVRLSFHTNNPKA